MSNPVAIDWSVEGNEGIVILVYTDIPTERLTVTREVLEVAYARLGKALGAPGISLQRLPPSAVLMAVDLDADQLSDLREQVDLALMDPDYSVVTNIPINVATNGQLLFIDDLARAAFEEGYMADKFLTLEETWDDSDTKIELSNMAVGHRVEQVMTYTVRPSYEMTINQVALRLCDIMMGRSCHPRPVQKDDGTPNLARWDVTNLNNHILHATPKPNEWTLSCRSPLQPHLVAFLAVELGLEEKP